MATFLYKPRPARVRKTERERQDEIDAAVNATMAELVTRFDAVDAQPAMVRPPLHAHALHTVAMMRMHRQLGTASQRRRVPRSRFPRLIEAAYASKLVAVVKHAASLVEPIISELKPLLERAQAERTDAYTAYTSPEHELARMDAGEFQQVRRLIDKARDRFSAAIGTHQLEALAQAAGQQASTAQRQLFARQARAALGIDITMLDKNIPTLIDHFVGENVSLIKTLGSKTFDDVEKMTTRAFSTGTRHEDLAEDLMDRFDISERHARLIARDQIGKITAQVAQSRSKDLGVRRFTWETVGDERVRPEHEDLEGEEFDYDEGAPVEGMPGEPICCRCSASPIFDDLLGEAADDDEED